MTPATIINDNARAATRLLLRCCGLLLLAGWSQLALADGRFEVLDGSAEGLWGVIKHDRQEDDARVIELWEPIRGDVGPGTMVRLHPGCNKRLETCRIKFNNIRNYQGFPDLPNDDWMMAVPRTGSSGDGGSLR